MELKGLFCFLQNAFPAKLRTVNINSMYLIFFNQIRDRSTIVNIAKQFCPGQTKYLLDAYKKCVSVKFRPLVLDFHQFSNDKFRVRSSLFPSEDCEIYLPE